MSYWDQRDYQIRFEWGINGVHACEAADVIVIVDVLSFSTCVDLVVSGGGEVLPFGYKDDRAAAYASVRKAILAAPKRSLDVRSLSPSSLVGIGRKRIVLPSPNGAELTLAVQEKLCYTACLRNAGAVARQLSLHLREGRSLAVIAAGERWGDNSLRVALEDLLGSGAVISGLDGTKSPEALASEATFFSCREDLLNTLLKSSSGAELNERGFAADVEIAAMLDASEAVPWLDGERYINLQL